jgi:hypothetical protein
MEGLITYNDVLKRLRKKAIPKENGENDLTDKERAAYYKLTEWEDKSQEGIYPKPEEKFL